MYNLRRLEVLRELKHRGTLAAVAAAMSYSPSAVSQQLTLLESEVGAPLLERDGRKVRLTPQAEILVAHTETVLHQLDRAQTEIAASLKELTGTLRVAAFQTAMLTLVPTALTWLRETHPGIRVEVTQDEPDTALSALLARDTDLVIDETFPGHPRPPQATELSHHVLGEEPMRLAVRDPTVRSLSELAQHSWAMEPVGTPARQWTVSLCHAAGFEPDVAFESADMLVHARLAAQGHAVAFLPDLLWFDRAPDVTLLEPAPTHRRTILATVRASANDHPLVRAVMSSLRHAVQEVETAAGRHLGNDSR
ncbi:LysR family transcriptional regulator [Streptomyces sp. Rer75]|uniref:LysR family transcriptional regulator n=1 Tax=unclassified Streptomyces TaxID=2593676 RepID=UPI0015D0BEF5|nr:LysR family transcriptional regulator [Streptomyces sp. Rer75]QLH27481.1 LysR family transcriptional regulator [Streptomyces sp. Rer75]